MCYRVYSHTLRCDTRPVLCDGENLLVDPYAPPRPCRCRSDKTIRSHDRCDDHGCCIMASRKYTCPAQCRTNVIYHIYIQGTIDHRVHFHHPPRELKWRGLPVFDGNIFPKRSRASREGHTCPAESVEFRLARDQILEVGRILDHGLLEIDKADFEARKLTHRHAGEHGTRCGKYSSDRGCVWLERIRNAREHGDNIEMAVEGFERLWRRWKVYLRNLERRGDRRVSGLEEWRRRDGRSLEREDYDKLMGFYQRDMRVDEKDARLVKEREREMEKQRQRYRADQMRYVPKETSRYEFPGDYSDSDDGHGGRKRSEDQGRRPKERYRDERTYADVYRR